MDTNIVLDLLDDGRKNHLYAVEILDYAISNCLEILISEDMLTTIYYINKDKQTTLEFFALIQEEWHIKGFGENVIKNGVAVAIKDSLDLEDTLQCLCAKYNLCDVLITNDEKFYKCGVDIVSSKYFVETFIRSR